MRKCPTCGNRKPRTAFTVGAPCCYRCAQRQRRTLTVHLERMHFSSHPEGIWELKVTLISSHGRRLTVGENYRFPWNFGADQACYGVAAAMVPAVQTLVRRAVTHPDFAGLLTP